MLDHLLTTAGKTVGLVAQIESAHGLELALDLPAAPPRRYGASTIQILRNGP